MSTHGIRFHWFHYASPKTFDALARRLTSAVRDRRAWYSPPAASISASMVAPTDAVQGDVYRIMFIHVPAAWMSMLIYVVMAGYAALGLIFNARLSAMMARALAPTGALFTFIALASGALWGADLGRMVGLDARLTSELILLFLYLGFLALHAAIDDPPRADRACAVLALAGVVNIPVIYFSVQWWYTLHQGASLSFGSGVSMERSMVWGIVVMTLALWSYTIAIVLARVRGIIRVRSGVVENVKPGGAVR